MPRPGAGVSLQGCRSRSLTLHAMSIFGTLPDITRLSDRVIRVMGGNPGKFTLQGTNTYLVGTGSKRVLIDTGDGKALWLDLLQKVLSDEKAEISAALMTHRHHDHVNGIPDLKSISPNTKIYKNEPENGQEAIVDGQTFSVKGATLTALHTPGHTSDHMCFYFHEEKALFTGDNVLGHGTTVFENLKVYMETLRRMRDTAGLRKIGYPGHGSVINDIKSKIEEYIVHREAREKQVIAVLTEASGKPMTSLETMRRIYKGEIPEELYPAAERGIMHILNFLGEEKKVIKAGEGWLLVDE